MDYRICCLPVRCYRVAVGLSRSLYKASDVRFPKTFTYSTLSPRTLINWQPCESHSLNFFQNQKPIGCSSFPNALSCRILHLTPNVSIGEAPSKAKTPQTNENVGSDQGKNQRENKKLDAFEKEQDSALSDGQHATESENADAKPLGLMQRFKQTYKEYGKVLIGVHVFTSCLWATGFYYAAVSGIDVVSLLKWVGASDKMIAPFTRAGVGHAAIAYLMYKLATPLRYMVTIGGTRVVVKILRRWGYMPPISEQNRFRHFVKEGQQKMRAKYEDRRKTKSEN